MASFTMEEIKRAIGASYVQKGSFQYVDGVSTDTRTIKQNELFIALVGENFDGHKFLSTAIEKKASAVVISDEKYIEEIDNTVSVFVVRDTKKALQDLAHFHRLKFNIPVIGITGSNGKTTTKDMLTSILKTKYKVCSTQKNFNNEIGLSFTLLSMTKDTEVCVVEMGMRGLGQITELTNIASPTMGVVTNVGTSHIGILGSQENIAKAKKELIDALPSDGIAVLNGDDPFVSKMGVAFDGKIITYGLNGRYTVRGGNVSYGDKSTEYVCTCFDEAFKIKLNLLGTHNVYDALAATAAGRALGVDIGRIARALDEFSPQEQRQSLVTIDGVTYLDDSYNANPLSMKMAFISLNQMKGNNKYLVLGDMGELGKFEDKLHHEVGTEAAKYDFQGLITVGTLTKHLAEGAKEGGLPVLASCENCEEAVNVLKDIVKPGDAVLIKGSHYMNMDSIIALLKGRLN